MLLVNTSDTYYFLLVYNTLDTTTHVIIFNCNQWYTEAMMNAGVNVLPFLKKKTIFTHIHHIETNGF